MCKKHLTGILIVWQKCRCRIARWKVGKCWEENRAGAALSCAVARLLSARFSEGWSGCCCCCSPGLAMARLQAFSHPVLSVLFNSAQQLWTLASWLSKWLWQKSKKLWSCIFCRRDFEVTPWGSAAPLSLVSTGCVQDTPFCNSQQNFELFENCFDADELLQRVS